jgi:hypothetical protein
VFPYRRFSLSHCSFVESRVGLLCLPTTLLFRSCEGLLVFLPHCSFVHAKGCFVFHPAPLCTSQVLTLSPSTGPTVGGDLVTISGLRFRSSGRVYFQLASGLAECVWDPTRVQGGSYSPESIVCAVPPGQVGADAALSLGCVCDAYWRMPCWVPLA